MPGSKSNGGVSPESGFRRSVQHGLGKYRRGLMTGEESLYTAQELKRLEKAGIMDRLPPRATAHYLDLASRSRAITNLIKARPEETEDLSGQRDPSNQLRYSPVPGLLHKYELVLLYVVRTCSSWCRYCYRSDFLTGKTEKEIADPDRVVEYIREYNARARAHGKGSHVYPIREALLSGGDPMVLSNRKLFDWLHRLAGAGVRTIRIGTKELAFYPYRFDESFFTLLDRFHELHPEVNLAFIVHFTHPDEFLEIDPATRRYVREPNGDFRRLPVVDAAVRNLRGRSYVALENQTPIISDVNDDPDAIRLLQTELKRMGVNNHYFFQCREIEGHRVFAVPVEEAWWIHSESQRGLSGIERSRFVMSTEAGKVEVVSMVNRLNVNRIGAGLPKVARDLLRSLVGEGLVVFKLFRSADPDREADLIIARRNPEALWMTGYEDRILYDGRLGASRQFAPLEAIVRSIADPGPGRAKPSGDVAGETPGWYSPHYSDTD